MLMNQKLLKAVMILGAVLLVTLLAGAMSYLVAARVAAPPTQQEVKKKEVRTTYPAGEYLTNLADMGSRRFIKVKVELVLNDPRAARDLEEKNGALRDVILGVLRSKTYEEVNGEEGMQQLGELIVKRVNLLVAGGKVAGIYFLEFIVQ